MILIFQMCNALNIYIQTCMKDTIYINNKLNIIITKFIIGVSI